MKDARVERYLDPEAGEHVEKIASLQQCVRRLGGDHDEPHPGIERIAFLCLLARKIGQFAKLIE